MSDENKSTEEPEKKGTYRIVTDRVKRSASWTWKRSRKAAGNVTFAVTAITVTSLAVGAWTNERTNSRSHDERMARIDRLSDLSVDASTFGQKVMDGKNRSLTKITVNDKDQPDIARSFLFDPVSKEVSGDTEAMFS